MSGIFLPYAEYSMYLTGSLPVNMINHNKVLYKYYGNILLMSFGIITLLMYVDMPFIWNDKSNLAESFNSVSIYTVLTMKVLVCKSKNIQKMISEMVSMDRRMRVSGDKNILKIRDMLIARGKIFQMYIVTFCVVGSAVVYLAYFITYVVFWDNDDIVAERPLPLFIWLPFNKNRYYLLGFAIHLYFAVICVLFYLFGHGLLVILPLYICYRLKILYYLISNVKKYTRKINSIQEIDDDEVTEGLFRYFVHEHLTIIRATRVLNNSIGYLMLVEFVILSALIALLSFKIISDKSMISWTFDVLQLITLLTQLFALYWYANEIRMDSLAVSQALYEINWYEYNKRITTTIQIMMIRAQRPLELSIGPFGAMSLQMFLTILKAAYSYITFLQRFASR